MDNKRQRKPRQTIELADLKSEPNSFLHLRFDDPVLRKLETYRLYQSGYAAEDIAQAFGLSRPYLYTLRGRVRGGRSRSAGWQAVGDSATQAYNRARSRDFASQSVTARMG